MQTLTKQIKDTQKKHIIFDFDETLFQLHLAWNQFFDTIENELKDLDKELLQKYQTSHISWADVQNAYVMYYGQPAKNLLIKNSERVETETFRTAIPNPTLIEEVRQLNNVEKYIWSSNSKAIITKVLKEHDLHDHFTKIITRTDVSLIKPSPEGFSQIFKAGDDKKEYLFVGDSSSDKKAAEAVGIDFFQITYF